MQILLALGVTLITATLPDQGQAALVPKGPINITFVKASFEEAVSFIAKAAGVTIEIDQTVSEERRREPISTTPIRLNSASVDDTLEWLTTTKGLSYSIVNAQTVRIYKKV